MHIFMICTILIIEDYVMKYKVINTIAGEDITNNLQETAYSVYYNATKWHFEDRIEKNGEHPTIEQVRLNDSGWDKAESWASVYHQDEIPGEDLKYTHPDGREAVFSNIDNGKEWVEMTDPRYMATYNYCPLYELPKNPGPLDYAKRPVSATGHFFADMVPYYLTLCSNTREQFESKIQIFD